MIYTKMNFTHNSQFETRQKRLEWNVKRGDCGNALSMQSPLCDQSLEDSDEKGIS